MVDLLEELRALLSDLRKKKRDEHLRHVSVGDLLSDRWQTAHEHNFGEGTSCYDNVLILGDVTVGKNCWIAQHVCRIESVLLPLVFRCSR